MPAHEVPFRAKRTMKHLLAPIRLFRHALHGHWMKPWRSPYLRWRIETYTGIPAETVDAKAFWKFLAQEPGNLLRFLRWTAEMERYAAAGSRNPTA
jgi:hypothetical protein